jgi:uncharacterized membrane protein
MKRSPFQTTSIVIRVTLLLCWGAICTAVLAAPLLAALDHHIASAFFYSLFSHACHQDAARSFTLLGHPWAVCQRCSGIYFGLFLFSLIPLELDAMLNQPRRRRLLVLVATAPMLADVFLPLTGLWANTPASRLATGLIFGAMLSSLLLPALAEFMEDAPWKRIRVDVRSQGGLV